MSNENEKWRKFLQPLVEVLLGLGLAMTAYFQRSGSSEFESRLAVVENKVGGIDELRRDVSGVLIGNIEPTP